MTRHRATAPTVDSMIREVLNQMTRDQVVKAALALTVGKTPYKALLTVAGRPVRLENRGSEARMGRFGGGWDFNIGIQMGRSGTQGTIIVNLGHGSIRIDPRKR
jgi:hypothetical protein